MLWIVGLSIVLGSLASGSLLASSADVVIKAAGEGYQGPPKLRLLADGRLVGERSLNKSIDTRDGQKLTWSNQKDHVQWVKFEVPSIENVARLEIEFLNDAWAGEGKSGDRNVVIYRVFVDGYMYKPNLLRPVPAKSGDAHPWQATLWSAGRLQLQRPAKGWRAGYKSSISE